MQNYDQIQNNLLGSNLELLNLRKELRSTKLDEIINDNLWSYWWPVL